MEDFHKQCSIPIFNETEFDLGDELSNGGCNATVYHGKINDKSCIAKLYDMEEEGWDIDDIQYLSDTLSYFKKMNSSAIIHALGFVIKENIHVYLLTEALGKDLSAYIGEPDQWTRSILFQGKYLPAASSPYIYNNGEDDTYWIYLKEESDKLEILLSMIDCVKKLHELDYVHLDIKPHNLVITEKKTVHMIDYDSFIHLEDQETCQLDQRLGTIGYCAPEQRELYASKKTDIYSLGVSMIEVWVGEVWTQSGEFQGCRNEVLRKLRNIEKETPELGKILRRCISPREKDRYTIHNLSQKMNEYNRSS